MMRLTFPPKKVCIKPGVVQTQLANHPRWQTTKDPLVVWLDDLQRFITHADPLTPTVLANLRRRPGHVVVVATLRSEERQRLREASGEFNREARILLEEAQTIELRSTSDDPAETAAAHDAYPGLRLDGGLAAELAGAPELLAQYDDAAHSDPVRYAVVQVVIDWARVGRHDPIPEPLLKTLAQHDVWAQRPELETEDVEITAAIKTARTPPAGAGRVAMLATSRGDDGVRRYRPFDYLVAADDGQDHPTRRIPDNIWSHALSGADPDQLFAVGVTAYTRGNMQTAITALTQAAEADSDKFSVQAAAVGSLYERMEPPDLDAARDWYERSADAGNRDAMYNLGVLYDQLMDAPDLDAARRWYERAADAGHRDAMYNLGDLLRSELDPPDLDAARRWYECAADAGHSAAMANLGNLFAQLIDPPDLDAARGWWERAADAGNIGAMYNLGLLHSELDPPDLDAARRWYEPAAEAGYSFAMYSLGGLYERMEPPDLDAARDWYRRAAEAGNIGATYSLEGLYERLLNPPESGGPP
jgi:TPR repeat protein